MRRNFRLTRLILLVVGSWLVMLSGVWADDPPAAKQAIKTFTNSKDGLAGNRASGYVDFSFNYPSGWALERSLDKDEMNFVSVERSIKKGGKEFTLENLNVGYFTGKGSGDKAVLALKGDELKLKVRDELVRKLKPDILRAFAGSKFTSEGLTKVGVYDGYELRFALDIKPKEGDPLTMWLRIVLVPHPEGGDNGVSMFMIGTSVAPELKAEKDLGTKGELPAILKSFKFGKTAKP